MNAQTQSSPPYEQLALFIDGTFIQAEGRHEQEIFNPSTGLPFARLPHATTHDLDRVLATASKAFQTWRSTSLLERSRILCRVAGLIRERAPAIARNITLDQGKPLVETMQEVATCAEHAKECRRIYGRVIPHRSESVRQWVVREPIGVCAASSPWNFPFNQALRKAVSALGAGCTLILKGPEDSPRAVVALARIFHDAGLPPGYLNIAWGKPAEISSYLIQSPIVRKISFTGFTVVGKTLTALAGGHMKRMTMELGGHSQVLVFDDADVEAAARFLAKTKTRDAGQVCIAPSRFFVHGKAYDRFVDAFAGAYGSLRVGNGLAKDTAMGPLTHARRVESMQALVADAQARGGSLVCGCERLDEQSFFFASTVVTGMPDDSRVMTEEPFGPVVPITRLITTDQVLARANALPYGLASFVFTKSLATATHVSNRLEAGRVSINHFSLALAETPLGGVKDSGMGSEGGVETFGGYLTTKVISQASAVPWPNPLLAGDVTYRIGPETVRRGAARRISATCRQTRGDRPCSVFHFATCQPGSPPRWRSRCSPAERLRNRPSPSRSDSCCRVQELLPNWARPWPTASSST